MKAYLSTKNVNVGARAGDGSGDTGDSEVSDGDAGGRGASWGAVLIILLNDDTVLGDILESDILVGDTRD